VSDLLVRPRAREDRPLVDLEACANPKRLELGVRLHEQGRYERAERVFASLDKPVRPHPQARYFRALCVNELGDPERAVQLLESVIADDPRFGGALYNLGYLHERQGRRTIAEIYYRRTLALEPTFVSAWLNLGNCLIGRGEFEDGIRAYAEAMKLAPRAPQPLINLAHTRLLLGDYAQGWRFYHERWNLPDFRARNGLTAANAGAAWVGQPIAGKRLVVFREQGTGDVLQMLRYDATLRAMGAEVTWRVPAHLLRLCMGSTASNVVTDAEPLPEHDYIVPVMSLPLFCGSDHPSKIPLADGYLEPRPSELVTPFEHAVGVLNVGVAWAGSAVHKRDKDRSIGIEAMAPLFTVPRCRFVNLQFGPREAEGDAYGLTRVDVSDYNDTALVLRQLDLVISVDTSVVHLAGGMRVPCWVMVTAIPDFRWMLGTSTSAWYRSVAIIRQPIAGDWKSVIRKARSWLTMLTERTP
jgi:Tfp pilus assembly protein PilF